VGSNRDTVGSAAGRSNLSVLPELSFRGALWAKLQSMSRPVSLCGHKRDLDPSPCIAVEDVTVDNPVAYRDREGDFHFKDHVDLSEVMALAKNKNFVLPVRIGGGRPCRLTGAVLRANG